MFSYISAARRVPEDRPLRAIRAMMDVALRNVSTQRPPAEHIYCAHRDSHADHLKCRPSLQ
jgi:hypothetical protein